MRLALAVLFLISTTGLKGQNMPIILPAIISDHAVLEQSSDVRLWGRGPATLLVNIVGSWAPTDTVRTLVSDECTWGTTIKSPSAGGPYTIQFISGTNHLTIKDILFGEVWLCSGQSNMALSCSANILDIGDARQSPGNNEMRFFQVGFDYDIYPRSDCKGQWVICDSTTMPAFSAAGYFFGRTLQQNLKVPVGLISAVMGATRIQPWMPKKVVENNENIKRVSQKIGANWAPQGVSILYNAMIHPLAPYTLAGVIWYQGETNACVDQEARIYGEMMKGLITGWREVFKRDFNFYFVQIAPFDGYYPKNSAAYLREQQESALTLPKTGMVTVGDLVDDVKDIHPGYKAGVGKRLANLALKEQYGFLDLKPYSPHFRSMEISDQKAYINTLSVGKLKCSDLEIKSFWIAGEDQKFYSAKALIDQDGVIVLASKKVVHPMAVRYCFSNEEMPNVFDVNGLPLMPFRTDNW